MRRVHDDERLAPQDLQSARPDRRAQPLADGVSRNRQAGLPQPLPGTGAIAEYAELGNFGMRVVLSYEPNTLAQQFTVDVLYGVAVLRNAGYQPPINTVTAACGAGSIITAFTRVIWLSGSPVASFTTSKGALASLTRTVSHRA